MSGKDQLILKTAERLFAAGRYHEITLDHLCKEAGIGKGTVYRYFEDKEDLYYQVILRGLDELVESVREVAEQEQDPARGLRLAARRLTDFYADRHALFSLMWSEQLRGSSHKRKARKQWQGKSDRVVDVLSGFIEKGLQRGVYELSGVSPAAAARLLMGMLRTGMRYRHQMPEGRDWAMAAVDLFERGLRARDTSNAG
jgi:AcrR family transcriptional regulator